MTKQQKKQDTAPLQSGLDWSGEPFVPVPYGRKTRAVAVNRPVREHLATDRSPYVPPQRERAEVVAGDTTLYVPPQKRPTDREDDVQTVVTPYVSPHQPKVVEVIPTIVTPYVSPLPPKREIIDTTVTPYIPVRRSRREVLGVGGPGRPSYLETHPELGIK